MRSSLSLACAARRQHPSRARSLALLVAVAVLAGVLGLAPSAGADPNGFTVVDLVTPQTPDIIEIRGRDLDAQSTLHVRMGDATTEAGAIVISPTGSPDPLQDPLVTVDTWTSELVRFSAPALFASLGRYVHTVDDGAGYGFFVPNPANRPYVPAVGESAVRLYEAYEPGFLNSVMIDGQNLEQLSSITVHVGDGTTEQSAVELTPTGATTPGITARVRLWEPGRIWVVIGGAFPSAPYVHRISTSVPGVGLTPPAPFAPNTRTSVGAAVTSVSQPGPGWVELRGANLSNLFPLRLHIGPEGGPTTTVSIQRSSFPGDDAITVQAWQSDRILAPIPFTPYAGQLVHGIDSPELDLAYQAVTPVRLQPLGGLPFAVSTGVNSIEVTGTNLDAYGTVIFLDANGVSTFGLSRPPGFNPSTITIVEWSSTRIAATIDPSVLDFNSERSREVGGVRYDLSPNVVGGPSGFQGMLPTPLRIPSQYDVMPRITSATPSASNTVRITGVNLQNAAELRLGVGDGVSPEATATIRVSPTGSPDPVQDAEITIVEWTPTSVTFSAPALFAALGRHLYDARTADGTLWVYRTPPNTLYVPADGEPVTRIGAVTDGGLNWITIVGQDLTSFTSLTLHLGNGTTETGSITVTPTGSPDPGVDAGLEVLNWGDESIGLRVVGLLETRGQYVHRVESSLGDTLIVPPVRITLPADFGAAITAVESPFPYVVRVWGPALMQAPSLSIDIGPLGGPTTRITARVDGNLLQPGEVLGNVGSSNGVESFDLTLSEAMIAAAGGAEVSRVIVPFLLLDHVVDPPVHVVSGDDLRPTITSVTAPSANTIVIEGSGFDSASTAIVWAGQGGFDLQRLFGGFPVNVGTWTDTRIEATVDESYLDQIGRVFGRVEVRHGVYEGVFAEYLLPLGFRIPSIADSSPVVSAVTSPAPNTIAITGQNLAIIQRITLFTPTNTYVSAARPDIGLPGAYTVQQWSNDRIEIVYPDSALDASGRTFSLLRYFAPIGTGNVDLPIVPPVTVPAPPVDDDSDDDGIADAIDDPAVPNGFRNGDLTPPTVGTVVDAAGLTVTVTDAADPDGVRVVVGAGSGQATLSVCGGFTLKVNPGSDLVLTCASVHLDVATGQAQIVDTTRGITITVPAGSSAAIDQAPNGFVVEEVTGAAVTVEVGGTTTTVPPGSGPVVVGGDTTAPTVTVAGVVAGGIYRKGTVTPGCTTTDADSGVATPAILTVTGGSNGLGTLTARCAGAVDNSGNAAPAVTVTYTVVRTRVIDADDDDIRARPGESLEVGYALRINGRHPATALRMVGVVATFTARCSNGRNAGTVTVNLSDATYQIARNDDSWVPASGRRNEALYQGSVVMPDLCNGGQVRLRDGELRFGLWSNQDDAVRVRWLHRVGRDVADWSDKERIIPG